MPGLWKRGTYRDTVIRRITDVPWSAIRCGCGPDAALSLYNDQLWSRSVRPQH
jgi:hypothetical protein